MKKLASLLAIVMAFSFAFNIPDAEARRFGGGKSMGRSFRTAPAPSRQQANPQRNRAERQQATNQQTQRNSNRRGMFGGFLGGLLAGGLIASLLGGGVFAGIQMMDILILGLLAFVLFKVFRSMNRARSMAGNHSANRPFEQQSGQNNDPRAQLRKLFGNNPQESQQDTGFDTTSSGMSTTRNGFGSEPESGFGANNVPMNVPADFNLNAFLNGSRDHFRTIQEAWNTSDFKTMQEYLSPELFAQMKPAREQLQGDQHTEVMFVDAEMVRADHNDRIAQISIRFSGKCRDTVEGTEDEITDIWHLERDLTQANAPWLIIGIES